MFDLSDNTALADLRVAGTTILGFSPKIRIYLRIAHWNNCFADYTYTRRKLTKVSVTKGDTSYVRVEAAKGLNHLFYYSKIKQCAVSRFDDRRRGVG